MKGTERNRIESIAICISIHHNRLEYPEFEMNSLTVLKKKLNISTHFWHLQFFEFESILESQNF